MRNERSQTPKKSAFEGPLELVGFLNGETEAQKGEVSSSRSCSRLGTELGLRAARITIGASVTRRDKEALKEGERQRGEERTSTKDPRMWKYT